MTTKREAFLKSDEELLSAIVLILAYLIGIIVRWNFIADSDFPINDGGFFFSLISDLIENRFRLPDVSSYNLAGIPYSYPPLAFYIVGVINKLSGIPIMVLLHYLPFGFNILVIPVFHSLSKVFFPEGKFLRALATFLFATLPRSFEWFVMGGGITRSLGFLFALLALTLYSKAAHKRRIGIDLVLAALFSSLTVLTHPISAVFLAFSIAVMTIYLWPIKIAYPAFIGVFVVLISSPWWITIISSHGLSPLLAASNTGHMDWFDLGYLLTLNFNFENRYFLHAVSFLAIIGLFSKERKKAVFLGALIGLGYLFVPRGGVDLLTGYLALLGTLGFDVVSRSSACSKTDEVNCIKDNFHFGGRSRIILMILIVYLFIGAFSYKFIDGKADLRLTEGDYRSMVWIRDNTVDTAKVMHLPPHSDYQDWWNDYFGEWMPAVTQRQSVATVQGHEWLPGEFDDRIEQYIVLRKCTQEGIDCIDDWVATYDNEFNYLLINLREHPKVLVDSILNSSTYLLVYKNDDVMIVKRDGGSS